MTLGVDALSASVEDQNLPDWLKVKSLRDIQMIRETKKNDIVNSVLGSSSDNKHKISVIPGRQNIIKIPLLNENHQREVFSITVIDPDQEFLQEIKNGKVISQRLEFNVPTAAEELTQLVKLGKVEKPPYGRWDLITRAGEICLDSNQKWTAPLIFNTHRSASIMKTVESSSGIVKDRQVKLLVRNIKGTIVFA